MIRTEKYCPTCEVMKSVSEFHKNSSRHDGLSTYCKACGIEVQKRYGRTKKGLIQSIYGVQKLASKGRKHQMPSYTLKELRHWAFSQKVFHELYDNWKTSGFEKDLRPSCDRLNDYRPYTLNNLQIVTWRENNQRSHEDRVNGMNNKMNRAVIGISLKTGKNRRFHSIHEAGRRTPADYRNIWKCLKKINPSAGGYKWEYALKN